MLCYIRNRKSEKLKTRLFSVFIKLSTLIVWLILIHSLILSQNSFLWFTNKHLLCFFFSIRLLLTLRSNIIIFIENTFIKRLQLKYKCCIGKKTRNAKKKKNLWYTMSLIYYYTLIIHKRQANHEKHVTYGGTFEKTSIFH